MNVSILRILLTAWVLVFWVPLVAAEDASKSYRMGSGDKIKIQVFGESDLSMESRIGESGLISYPFLGELLLKDKTPLEFERELATKLKDGYLINPEVTVTVVEYRKFFMDGYVRSPGGFQYRPGMTVRKAISLAGGFGDRADRKKITLVRSENAGVKGPQAIGIDDLIEPGDVITVGRSFF